MHRRVVVDDQGAVCVSGMVIEYINERSQSALYPLSTTAVADQPAAAIEHIIRLKDLHICNRPIDAGIFQIEGLYEEIARAVPAVIDGRRGTVVAEQHSGGAVSGKQPHRL